MRKRYPIINPKKCDPLKCNHGTCIVLSLCTMKNIIQEEQGETPSPLGPCKACGKCVTGCPLHAISLD